MNRLRTGKWAACKGLLLVAVLLASCVGDTDRTLAPDKPDSKASARQSMSLRLARLADGDSFDAVDRSGNRYGVRIAAIDAPERGQAGSWAARRYLGDRLKRRWFTLKVGKTDRYGRLVGTLLIDSKDIGLAMVSEGLVWHFRRYEHEQPASERARYRAAQRSAREAGKGIWKEDNPTPPWQWRRENRNNRR